MDYDEALSRFLETYECDEIFNGYFAAIRRAFMAGYRAAGGEIPAEQPVLRMIFSDGKSSGDSSLKT